MSDLLEQVGRAIDLARCEGREGPYGFYDYSSYGYTLPFHVRDFRDPKSTTYAATVFSSNNRALAQEEYRKLTRHHIALAAIRAVREYEERERRAELIADGWTPPTPSTKISHER